MSHTDPPSKDKLLVQNGYDQMAEEYTTWALESTSPRHQYISALLGMLPPQSAVLELGCGAGAPVLETLTQHPGIAKVLANDISARQMDLAKERCPSATFLPPGDMTELDLEAGGLDAVVAFYSILHLPRDEQPGMLGKICRWLKSGGLLVCNFGTKDEEEIRGKFHGADMFWSSFAVDASKKMVIDAGFEVLKTEVLETAPDLKPGDPDYGIKFLWFIARKP